MNNFELLTDTLCHQFPLSKTRGLRSSRYSLSQEQSVSELDLAEFPTAKQKTKTPYLSFKPKTQFQKRHQYHLYQQFKSIQKQSIIQVSSVLKQQNTAVNSYASSGSKFQILQKNTKQVDQCPSPIKVNQTAEMTHVNQQMINVLMKMMERMDKMEKLEIQERQSKQQQPKRKSEEKQQRNHNHNHNHKMKQSQCYCNLHPHQSLSLPDKSNQNPQIVINNIIKGKSELSQSKQSRIYDIMDFQLKKHEEIIKKLEIEKLDNKRDRVRYKTPDITQFQIEIDRFDKCRKNNTKEMNKSQAQDFQQVSPIQSEQLSDKKSRKNQQHRDSSNHGNQHMKEIRNKFKKLGKIQNNSTILAQVSQQPALQTKTQPVIFQQIKKSIALDFPINNKQNVNISLAQAFQKRRQNVNSERPKQQRRQKSKQELAEIRRKMMKRRATHQSKPQSIQSTILDSASTSMKQSKREPSKELLQRLINGSRSRIDYKDMRALTQKNYDLLPEVKQKKQEKRKKQDLQRRMIQKREYQKSIRKQR